MAGADGSILVVDDEAVIRELMTDILGDEGYRVEAAEDGVDALRRLEPPHPFVLLFTDIMMPQMDGITLIREARKRAPGIIPIVMTAYATLETARDAVREGAYDYILKPFSLSEIRGAVANAFERHELQNENAQLRDLAGLFDVSETIASFQDEAALLEFVLRAAVEKVGAGRASIMVALEDGQTLEVAAGVGLPEEFLKKQVKFGQGVAGWVAERRRPLRVAGRPAGADTEIFRADSGSFVSVPLIRNPARKGTLFNAHGVPMSDVLAVLNVSDKTGGSSFTDGDLKLLRILANHAAAALENVRLIGDVEHAHLATLQSMALALEEKDPYLHGHSERVRNYALIAGQKLGMSQEDLDILRVGAMLHDVGKIGVSDAVLNKPGGLDPSDWDSIRQHPVIGHDMLASISFLTNDHLTCIRHHHERLDGSGYPDGIGADNLDHRVRVLAVADTFDAMSGDRAYRRAMHASDIVAELRRCAGTTLDAGVVAAFVELLRDGNFAPHGPIHPFVQGEDG